MTAHITKTKGGYELAISPTFSARDWVNLYRVADKRQARAIAKQHGAKPWNF